MSQRPHKGQSPRVSFFTFLATFFSFEDKAGFFFTSFLALRSLDMMNHLSIRIGHHRRGTGTITLTLPSEAFQYTLGVARKIIS